MEQISYSSLLILLDMIIFLGLCFLIAGIILLVRAGPSQFWPATRARIIYSLIEESKSQKRLADGNFKTINKYEPVIVYKYMVRKTAYTSRKITPRPTQFSPRAAKNLTRRYPRGLSVKIRYNPIRPEDSVLLVPSGWFGIFLTAGGLIIVSAGIFLIRSLTN